jgi:hypothetical protein
VWAANVSAMRLSSISRGRRRDSLYRAVVWVVQYTGRVARAPASTTIGLDDISFDEVNEPTLPTLLPSLHLQPPRTMLPPSSSPLFVKNLYMRTLLDTTPPTIRVTCSQPDCGYSPQPLVFSDKSTGNLWKHYTQKHSQISFSMRKNDHVQAASSPSSSSSFFELKKTTAKQPVNASKYRNLLLQFVVSNNLSLRLVDSLSFRQIIQFLSPITLSVSARTLHRDLQRRFSLCRAQLQSILILQMEAGYA